MDDHKATNSVSGQATTLRELVRLAIGHSLVTVGLISLFVTLVSVETPMTAAFGWALIFGMAAAGIVLVRTKESKCATIGIIVVGCALWLIRAMTH